MHRTGGTLCYARESDLMLMEKRMRKLYIMILTLVGLLFANLLLANILINYDHE